MVKGTLKPKKDIKYFAKIYCTNLLELEFLQMRVDSRKENILTGNLINNVIKEGYLFHLQGKKVLEVFVWN